jgi:creatinine amidohydrolase
MDLCVLPVGAIEQHGPHLPLVTDSLIATAICHEASSRARVPVLPTLEIASSHAHTTRWPGTLSIPPRMLIAMVVELTTWIRAAGFSKLLIVNAHGGNQGPLRVAVDEIRCGASRLQVGLINYFDISPEIHELIFADGEDVHANSAETSLVLHLRPDLVDLSAIRDDADRTPGKVFSYTVAQTSREGLTGRPSEGSVEAGKRLFELIVTAVEQRLAIARTEAIPIDG